VAASPTARSAPRRVERRPGVAGFAAVTVVPDAARAVGAPPAPLVTPSLTLVLRAPSGVAAECAGLDVAGAAALLRAVLAPAAPA